jgi:hypothetical protein
MVPVTTQTLMLLLSSSGLLGLGYLLGSANTVRRRDRDLGAMRHQADVQLRFTEQQFQAQRDAEREGHLRERTEEAHDTLGRWLHDLDRTIDEVWAGVCSAEEAVRAKAHLIVRRWPWETLAVPVYASGAQLYWSSEVRTLIRKFDGTSAKFIMQAAAALTRSGDADGIQQVRGDLWKVSNDLHGVLSEVRDQARLDLGVR